MGVDEYLAGLAAHLRGPYRLRADLLAEARDSLHDAAQAHRAAGVPADEAERLAVAEFGGYADVVPGYQTELAVAQGRRTALLLALALPALTLLAPLMWWHGPWTRGAPDPGRGYALLVAHFDYLSLTASAVAVLVLLGLRVGSRRLVDGLRFSRAVGWGTLGFLAVHGAAGIMVLHVSVHKWPQAATWPPLVLGSGLMGAGFLYAVRSAWGCVKAGRLPGGAVPARSSVSS